MDATTIWVLTVAAFVVGVVSWGLPALRFLLRWPQEWVAILFILAGVVLMTTFKWTEIALEILGARLHISELESKLNEAEATFASITASIDPVGQDKITKILAGDIYRELDAAGISVTQTTLETAIKKTAARKENFQVFTGSTVDWHRLVREGLSYNPNSSGGGILPLPDGTQSEVTPLPFDGVPDRPHQPNNGPSPLGNEATESYN